MKSQKSISIIVPVYNVEPFIKECLDSIVNQTYKNLDIVLVDDGSTDNSGRICDEYAVVDKRITVLHKENGGLVSARKAGVTVAKGDFVIIVDSDDWIELDEAERVIKAFDDNDCDLVCFGYYKEHDVATDIMKPLLPRGKCDRGKIEHMLEVFLNESEEFTHQVLSVTLWSYAYKLSIYKEFQLEVNDGISIGEDAAVTIPLISKSNSLFIDDRCYYHYRVRETSIVHSAIINDLCGVKLLKQHLLCQSAFYRHVGSVWDEYKVQYLVYIMLLYAPQMFVQDGKFALYPTVQKGDSVIVFGKGVYGKKILEIMSGYVDVRGVFDSSSLNELRELINETDYIIIAILAATSVRFLKNKLKDLGIPDRRIIYIAQKHTKFSRLPECVKRFLVEKE